MTKIIIHNRYSHYLIKLPPNNNFTHDCIKPLIHLHFYNFDYHWCYYHSIQCVVNPLKLVEDLTMTFEIPITEM